MSDQILKNFKNGSNSQNTFHYDWIWVLKLFGIFLGPFLVIFDDFSDPRVILEVKIGCFAFFELLTSNSSRTLKSAYFLIPSKPRAPLCLSFLGKLSKIKTVKHMEFSICLLTPPPPYQHMENSFVIFLLSKKDFWLILRLFHFFLLKDQKYLENSHYLAQRMVVEGGGYIREKNKSV